MGTTPRTLIQIRVTPEEKQYVEDCARGDALSVSDYVRGRLFGTSYGNTTPGVGHVRSASSNSALYASASHVAAVEAAVDERLTSLEAAIKQGTTHIKKPTKKT